jgi:hypothetical protein
MSIRKRENQFQYTTDGLYYGIWEIYYVDGLEEGEGIDCK